MLRNECRNIGSITALYLIRSCSAATAFLNGEADLSAFEAVGIEEGGSYEEQATNGDDGVFYEPILSFFIRKDRQELGGFEASYFNREVDAVVRNGNMEHIHFSSLRMARVTNSGQSYSDAAGRSYTLSGISTESGEFVQIV